MRGVYFIVMVGAMGGIGSSPLARGLPQAPKPGRRLGGIIPACAGFTTAIRLTRASTKDHPRLRGVYDIGVQSPVTSPGSSPLARGLLTAGSINSGWRRIIPACAGFTKDGEWTDGEPQDHPRLRGVYLRCAAGRPAPKGSSPLARGLRCHSEDRVDGGGIIPACAGFTSCRGRLVVAHQDHPRLRGVYDLM